MDINKMIEQWQEKHTFMLSAYNTLRPHETKMLEIYRGYMKSILDFIEDLKQIKNNIVLANVSGSLPIKDNPYYLQGLLDGYGGEEPLDELPHGFKDINEVWERLSVLNEREQSNNANSLLAERATIAEKLKDDENYDVDQAFGFMNE